LPQNFPIRYLIISGLGREVVVVGGTESSGSLITARLEMEFALEEFGGPGNRTQPTSFDSNQLIEHGAKLVTSWEDMVEELPRAVQAELVPVEAASPGQRKSLVEEGLAPAEKPLLERARGVTCGWAG
jgi:DNA processing protein